MLLNLIGALLLFQRFQVGEDGIKDTSLILSSTGISMDEMNNKGDDEYLLGEFLDRFLAVILEYEEEEEEKYKYIRILLGGKPCYKKACHKSRRTQSKCRKKTLLSKKDCKKNKKYKKRCRTAEEALDEAEFFDHEIFEEEEEEEDT